MKKALFITLMVVLSFCYQPVHSLSAVWVDDSYPDLNEDSDGDPYFITIGAALLAVESGGIVTVAAGTYYGHVLLDKNDLTLKSSDGPAVTIIDFTGVWCGYWSTGTGGVDIPCGTSGVTVEGFTIKGGSPASDALVSIGGDNNIVTNNIIIGDPLSAGQDIGIHIGDVGEASLKLPSRNRILGNEVYNHAGSGIFVGNWAGTGNVISGNLVHDNVVGGIPGLNGNGIEADRVSGISIINNTIFNNEFAGIKIVRTAPFAVIDVYRNTLTNNGNGIVNEAWRPGAIESAVVSVTCNNIFGNVGFGFLNNVGVSINSSANWWGNVNGPYHVLLNPFGMGDEVSDNVNFLPWSHVQDPCTPQGNQVENPQVFGRKICPLAEHNIEEAENLLNKVQELFDDVRTHDSDIDMSAIEKLLNEARKLLERAKTFCMNGQNCIAANNLALEAQNLLEEAQELLQSMLE
ncbi:MAG: right-handed parallel beta-helix repeat-containing protein [Theionarchaea archaeon]|nr:right-handed parallel beta-helix repeat-containing protein [Theionarchaea archaeon]